MKHTLVLLPLALLASCAGDVEPKHLTLHQLCASGDATPETIQYFLDLGTDVNLMHEVDLVPLRLTIDVDGDGEPDDSRGSMSPLGLAAMFGNEDAVLHLIQAGAEVDRRCYSGRQPLYLAARFNSNPEVIKLLLASGADVNAKLDDGVTPLHVAAYGNSNPEVIKLLLASGADVSELPDGLREEIEEKLKQDN